MSKGVPGKESKMVLKKYQAGLAMLLLLLAAPFALAQDVEITIQIIDDPSASASAITSRIELPPNEGTPDAQRGSGAAREASERARDRQDSHGRSRADEVRQQLNLPEPPRRPVNPPGRP